MEIGIKRGREGGGSTREFPRLCQLSGQRAGRGGSRGKSSRIVGGVGRARTVSRGGREEERVRVPG
jgi:hypothetical protein